MRLASISTTLALLSMLLPGCRFESTGIDYNGITANSYPGKLRLTDGSCKISWPKVPDDKFAIEYVFTPYDGAAPDQLSLSLNVTKGTAPAGLPKVLTLKKGEGPAVEGLKNGAKVFYWSSTIPEASQGEESLSLQQIVLLSTDKPNDNSSWTVRHTQGSLKVTASSSCQ